VKNHESTATMARLVEVDRLAVLIRQDDIGEALPYRWADVAKVNAKVHSAGHRRSFSSC
jgi:hypothetical protein